jgi:hypothetical protein
VLKFLSNIFGYKFWIGFFIITSALFIVWHNNEQKQAEERIRQEVTTALYNEYNKRLVLLQDAHISSQNKLITKHQEIQNETQASLNAVNAKYVNLLRSVSERPSRETSRDNSASSSTTCPTEVTPRCNGAGLFREDAEFLAGFATNAEQMRLSLLACYKSYDSAKKILQEYQDALPKPLEGPTER